MKAENEERDERQVAVPHTRPGKLLKRRAIVLAALLAVILLAESESVSKLPRLCPWYNLTGIDCPFCGLTRSVIATADLHPALALRFHPFGPLVLAMLVGWFILCSLGLVRGGRMIMIPRWLKVTSVVLLASGWLCWWIYFVLSG